MQTAKYTCPVLVVEDNEDLCLIFRAVLGKTCGFHIENTLKGAELFLADNKTAIIFLDNNLPDGSGILHIRTMLDQQPEANVVVMTADTADGLPAKAISEGAMSFLRKPFKLSLIKDIIVSVCPEFAQ